MDLLLLSMIMHIKSIAKFVIFTVILFVIKKIFKISYKFIQGFFRLIRRKIKDKYFKINSPERQLKNKQILLDVNNNFIDSEQGNSKQSDNFKKGLDFENKGDYENAIKFYTKSANKGCPSSQYNLSLIYYSIEYVKSYKYAKKWLKQAIKGGIETAVGNNILGKIYFKQEDYEKSIKSFIRSSDLNDSIGESEYELYNIYRKGLGVVENQYESIKWLYKSAELNFPKAQYYLGMHYIDTKDYDRAAYWIKSIVEGDSYKYKKVAKEEWGLEKLWRSLPDASFNF